MENIIKRKSYISNILKFKDINIIKILVGVRRSGKTTIMKMLQDELISMGISKERIIYKKYSLIEFDKKLSSSKMYEEIKQQLSDNQKYYLFLDEIQEIPNWEKVVNTLFEEENVDIYVTGSNSKLMASEISTYLSGRYVTIPIFTLSFKEYKEFKKERNLPDKELLIEYIKNGGFPVIAVNDNSLSTNYQIVNGIYNTVITRDIMARHHITNQELFDRVIKYIIDNVGKTFSANTIVKFLKSENRKIDIETVYNYLKWLTDAFIVYKCQRYDIKGKSILKTQEKYYLSDISIKNSLFGYNIDNLPYIIENIVYLELLNRGFDVHIGKFADKEIDFVAQRRDERIYIQVCCKLPEESNREIDNLKSIKDNYPKYIITLDPLQVGNFDGIKMITLEEFLIN